MKGVSRPATGTRRSPDTNPAPVTSPAPGQPDSSGSRATGASPGRVTGPRHRSTPCPSNPITPHDSTHRPRPSSGRSPPWPVTPACDTSLRTDDVWAVDPTPIEYGHSRETTRHAPPGPGRLHLSTATAPPTPRSPAAPRPCLIATGRVRTDRRESHRTPRRGPGLGADPALLAGRHHQVTIADKNHHGRGPGSSDHSARPSSRSSTPPRGQLDLEEHGGHTITGAAARAYQRPPAPTAAIGHNDHTGQPVQRSLSGPRPSTLASCV